MNSSPIAQSLRISKESLFEHIHPKTRDSNDLRRNLMSHLGPQKPRNTPYQRAKDFNFDVPSGVDSLRKLSENEMLINAGASHQNQSYNHSY